MRVKIIYALVALLLVATFAARAGNGADARIRSRCAAIGYALRSQAADKSADIDRLRAANPVTATQWDAYLRHVDDMGKVLIDTFAGPQPTRGADRAWAAGLQLQALTHAGEGCTGEKR